MIHARVVNVRKVPRSAWEVYAGRTVRGVYGVPGEPMWVPHTFTDDGWGNLQERARKQRGKVWACWCAGVHEGCHAVVWARLADGESLDAIRRDVLAALGLEDGPGQSEMFPAPVAGEGDEA